MLNLPGWLLIKVSPTLSGMASNLTFLLIIVYFILARNWVFNRWMVFLGVLYFGIASLTDQRYLPSTIFYLPIVIKYFVLVIAGFVVIKDTKINEFFAVLLLGSLTVFLQIFLFYDPLTDGDRFSGFYLNPNSLGFICMMGYALCFGVQNKWRLLGQIVFTAVGFLTFSRTFIIVWLLINLFSIKISFKNIKILAIGLGLFVGLLTFNAFLPKSNPRLDAMSNLLTGKSNNTKTLKHDGRNETWAIYYDALMEKPFLGHGFNAFEGGGKISPVGPHNSYIKTWGEGGLFTVLLMLLLYGTMLLSAWRVFKQEPHLFLMTLAFCLFISTNHSYWINHYLLFFSMWLQYQLFNKPNMVAQAGSRERLATAA